MAEVLIYHGPLTQAELASVATYLKTKYNYGEDVGDLYPPVPLTNCEGIQAAGGITGDLDNDCAVNLSDLAMLVANWLTNYDPLLQ